MRSICSRSASLRSSSARGDAVLDVAGVPCAHDRHLDGRVGERPGDREPADRDTELLLGESLELANRRDVAAEVLALEEGRSAAPVVWGEGRVLVHRSGEQPVGERPVDQDTDLVFAAVGQDLRFDPAAEEVVRRLERLHRPRLGELGHLLAS